MLLSLLSMYFSGERHPYPWAFAFFYAVLNLVLLPVFLKISWPAAFVSALIIYVYFGLVGAWRVKQARFSFLWIITSLLLVAPWVANRIYVEKQLEAKRAMTVRKD